MAAQADRAAIRNQDANAASGVHQAQTMTRRAAILRVSALLGGGALIGQSALLAGCATAPAPAAAAANGFLTSVTGDAHPGTVFTPEEIALLDEIAETILPETSTPGAKAAGVGPFMAHMVLNAYSPRQQGIFRSGMLTLEDEALRALGTPFMSATPNARLELLRTLDREQFEHMAARAGRQDVDTHYFRMMKELALLGYFTSEIGCEQAQRYVETPGQFDPDVPYAPGDRAWAAHA